MDHRYENRPVKKVDRKKRYMRLMAWILSALMALGSFATILAIYLR